MVLIDDLRRRASQAEAAQPDQMTVAGQQCDFRQRHQLVVIQPEIVLGVDQRCPAWPGSGSMRSIGVEVGAQRHDFDAEAILDDVRLGLRRPVGQLVVGGLLVGGVRHAEQAQREASDQ